MENKAKQYQRIKLIFSISETIVSLVLLCVFIFAGYSLQWRIWISAQAQNPYLQLLIFIGGISLAYSIISIILGYEIVKRG